MRSLVVLGKAASIAVVMVLCSGIPSGSGSERRRRISSATVAKEFVYPKAKQLGDTYGGEAVYLAKYVTKDKSDAVFDWYQEKIANVAQPRSQGISWGGFEGNATIYDSKQPQEGIKDGETDRKVAVSVFTRRTASHTTTIVVSYAKGELHTHVVITTTQNKVK